jgi:hypothetical protein
LLTPASVGAATSRISNLHLTDERSLEVQQIDKQQGSEQLFVPTLTHFSSFIASVVIISMLYPLFQFMEIQI